MNTFSGTEAIIAIDRRELGNRSLQPLPAVEGDDLVTSQRFAQTVILAWEEAGLAAVSEKASGT